MGRAIFTAEYTKNAPSSSRGSHTVTALSFARILLSCCTVISASGNITVAIDKLDDTDGVSMPPSSTVIVDFSVAPSESDAWFRLGISGFALGGTRLQYASDPNTALPVHSAPGEDNRFVTFFSRPRTRDGAGRFGIGAYVTALGSYNIGAIPILDPLLVDIVVGPLPPEEGRAGYIGRIALDLSAVNDARFRVDSPDIVIATEPPPGSTTLFQTFAGSIENGLQIGSDDGDSHFVGFGVYGIPEPASWMLLALGGSAAFGRRASR